MLAWLWDLIVGRLCLHRWEVYEDRLFIDEQDRVIGKSIYLQCTKCGNIVNRRYE